MHVVRADHLPKRGFINTIEPWAYPMGLLTQLRVYMTISIEF